MGLNPDPETLRLIEDASGGDDVKLQSNFQAYGECNSKGKISSPHEQIYLVFYSQEALTTAM
jgi:hypothetical protein